MPKGYFFDTGIRNYLLNNFAPITLRVDKGEVLEQRVRQQLKREYGIFDIHYRRNKHGQEVDFIIQKKQAREIKRNKTTFKASRYQQFQKDYPQINLMCKDYEDIIQWSL